MHDGVTDRKYSVSFNFEKGNYSEVITGMGLDSPANFDLGQVSFGLAGCMDEEAMLKFLQQYCCTVVYDDVDPVPVEEGSPWFTFLSFNQAALRSFIKVVLLKPAPAWAYGVPPSRRVPVFHHQHTTENIIGNFQDVTLIHITDNIMGCFQDITLEPVIAPRIESWRGFNFNKGTVSPGLQEALKIWNKAWDEKDKKAEHLYNEITRRRTVGFAYKTDNLISIAWLELYCMADRDIGVLQCKRCGGYFIPKAKKVYYCDNCKKPYSRQALYAAIKREGMTEEEKAKVRANNKQTKATSRLVQKLHEEGKSIREISNETGRAEDKVRMTLKNKVR